MQENKYSWRKKGNLNVASRLDFALISAGLDQKANLSMYLPGIQTDHRAVYLAIDLDPFERGPGFWKLNTTLLQRQELSVRLMRKLT